MMTIGGLILRPDGDRYAVFSPTGTPLSDALDADQAIEAARDLLRTHGSRPETGAADLAPTLEAKPKGYAHAWQRDFVAPRAAVQHSGTLGRPLLP